MISVVQRGRPEAFQGPGLQKVNFIPKNLSFAALEPSVFTFRSFENKGFEVTEMIVDNAVELAGTGALHDESHGFLVQPGKNGKKCRPIDIADSKMLER